MVAGLLRSGLARVLALAALIASACAGGAVAQQADDTATAFRNFVMSGNYDNANFYLTNKLIEAKDIDTSQLFFDVLMEKYATDLNANAGKIDKLYNFLTALVPIDLNRQMRCGYPGQERYCMLAGNLLTGARRDAIAYFVERGLDLNRQVAGIVPATVPMILRLGVNYSIDDLNFFVSKGMVLGDELYPVQDLASYLDTGLYNQQLRMPDNYLTLQDQNLLDVLVIALGTRTHGQNFQESAHKKTLCDFIAYAAPSFTPSFDYLSYVLETNEQFRGSNIGKMERESRSIYEPFPASCVTLIRNMAASHARVDKVISQFAGKGDVDTANWLIGIKQGTQ